MRLAVASLGMLLVGAGGCNLDGVPSPPGTAPDLGVAPVEPDLATCPAPELADAGPGITSTVLPGCTLAPLVSPAELASTPRADGEAETLALGATASFVAPEEVYRRVSRDLAAIRCARPELSRLHAGVFHGYLLLWFHGPSAAIDDIQAGRYHDWDCLNALYDFHVAHVQKAFSNDTFVTLESRGVLATPQLFGDYGRLPGDPVVSTGGGGIDGDRVCLRIDGDRYRFLFIDGQGDCPSGCTSHHYWNVVTEGPGRVSFQGEYDSSSGPPIPEWTVGLPCW